MIKQLKLTNFRQFTDTSFDFKKNIIVIHGNNTKGKSTILEAIYLITNGQSPWADFEDEFNTDQSDENKHFRIEIQNNQERAYAYFRDSLKRQLKLNGANTTSKKFFENISSVMFSPEQIDLLMISSSKRREFIDQILSKIDIEYDDIISKFHKSLKQRNAYLKRLSKKFYDTGELPKEDSQLGYWSDQIAKYSAKIMTKRSQVIAQLKNKELEVIYNPSVTLNLFEDIADTQSLQRIIRELLDEKVKRDIATGFTNIGAHRDDWTIMQGKEIKRFGSRGEKRMAIGKLIFLTLELIADKKGVRPILLLDDIPSELDTINTRKILSDKIFDQQQTFITTIELSHIPKEILKKAQVIDLN